LLRETGSAKQLKEQHEDKLGSPAPSETRAATGNAHCRTGPSSTSFYSESAVGNITLFVGDRQKDSVDNNPSCTLFHELLAGFCEYSTARPVFSVCQTNRELPLVSAGT